MSQVRPHGRSWLDSSRGGAKRAKTTAHGITGSTVPDTIVLRPLAPVESVGRNAKAHYDPVTGKKLNGIKIRKTGERL